jgi:transglycosylase-like protein with SLT domain
VSDLVPDPDALTASQSQPEFETSIWEYVDAAETETRIRNGQGKLAEWAPVLDAVEAQPAEVAGKHGTERQDPAPDGFVRDRDTPLRQQLNIAVGERERNRARPRVG